MIAFRALAVCLTALVVLPTVVASQIATAEPEYTGQDRIENWSGKRILVVTPHPDDETFTSAGTLAMLAEKGNQIHVLIYTSDNAGSRDPSMTHERLAAIRKAEEERACEILGLPIGTVTSRIARARARLVDAISNNPARQQGVAGGRDGTGER